MPFKRSDDGKAKPVDFPQLERLRLFARQILQDQEESLKSFAYDVGYQHYDGKNKISVSSSATCVLSLVATGKWKADKATTKRLLHDLILKNTSAGLPKNNPFTIAWILEAVTALEKHSEPLDAADISIVAKMEKMLANTVKRGHGGVKIEKYPPSAYLTQLVVRALNSRSKLTDKLREMVSIWAWAELTRQIALIRAKTKTADPFAVGYLIMLAAAVTPSPKITPEQTSTQRSALRTFFHSQIEDGTWPLSRPLFHYRKFGNAYCYEYEMLTQLLQQRELQDLLLEHLKEIRAAAESVSNTVYRLGDGIQVWTSGHHPQQAKPESWATASVYHFLQEVDRLLAEAVRRDLFRYLDLPFPRPGKTDAGVGFAPEFLDSIINVDDEPHSLKNYLWEKFVKPLADEAGDIVHGGKFKNGTPISAIFFGPPGTSKTELSKKIADFLGWPLFAIDPSHLLRNGMDGIQAEANAIFRRLAETERVVVLLDEFDEFVRERDSSDAEQFSRLLTTAMLPKLASIHRRATLVFIIATNNIGQFDLAIQRPGRFDRVVQIMPPTYDAKIAKTNWGINQDVNLGQKLQSLGLELNQGIRDQLADLTYLECDAFATELASAQTQQEAIQILEKHSHRCILHATAQDQQKSTKTWKERCKEEEQYNR
jgi:ATPase family associated with various cellular activities (AAA)